MLDGSVLVVEIAGQRLTRIFADGRKKTVAVTGGGPNGAAIGPDGRCYLCNNGGMKWHEKGGRLLPGVVSEPHPGGWIEAVDLATGAVEILYRGCNGQHLNAPNDIVFDAHGGFWFTDHGKSYRRSRDRGAIYYAKADGSFIREVVFPSDSPNGIGLSPDGQRLYVAETHTARIWSYAISAPGEIAPHRGVAPWEKGRLVIGLGGYALLDSLAVEECGNICVANIPEQGITVVSPDGRVIENIAMPDEVTTNICFGGPDMQTAFITLSSTGQLVSVRWPRPGLRLNNAKPE